MTQSTHGRPAVAQGLRHVRKCTYCATRSAVGYLRHCPLECPNLDDLGSQHAQRFYKAHGAMRRLRIRSLFVL